MERIDHATGVYVAAYDDALEDVAYYLGFSDSDEYIEALDTLRERILDWRAAKEWRDARRTHE